MQHSSTGTALSYPPLPRGITIERVYADFIRFLYKATGEFFKQNINGGDKTWSKLQGTMEFIFAIPNGWDARQQGFLRDAAIEAGLLPRLKADDRIKFVTEAEASVHFAIAHSETKQWMKPGAVFAILDAGGSTVDTTLYRCKTVKPRLTLEEVRRSECVQVSLLVALIWDNKYNKYFRRVGYASTTQLRSYLERGSKGPISPRKRIWR
jgi:hypothetical protein